MPADASELRAALSDLITAVGDDAAAEMFQSLNIPRDSGELEDSGNVEYLGGTNVSGEWLIEFTAPQGEYTDQPVDEIHGNPTLHFKIGGKDIFVTSVTPSKVHEGWFTDAMVESAWLAACEAGLQANAF